MGLGPNRVRAYTCGALTGAFTALALVARGDEDRPSASLLFALAAVCGFLSVRYEERATADA